MYTVQHERHLVIESIVKETVEEYDEVGAAGFSRGAAHLANAITRWKCSTWNTSIRFVFMYEPLLVESFIFHEGDHDHERWQESHNNYRRNIQLNL